MNGQKSITEAATSATGLSSFDVVMSLHVAASDLRVAWAALNDGNADSLIVSGVAVQLDRMQRQLDELAGEIDEHGVAP